jgi:hypothetical protein
MRMETGYNILFTLHITLGTNPARDFSILPLPATLSALADHGLVFKAMESGCLVAGPYRSTDAGTTTLPRPLVSTRRFSFAVQLRDAHFLKHADLQITGQDTRRVGRRIYYFSNLDTHNTIDGAVANRALSLAGAQYVSTAELWSVIPASFSFTVDAASYTEVKRYQVMAGAPDTELTPVYSTGDARGQFILGGNPPGPYRLSWEGTPARAENLYADNELVTRDFFALVDIYKDAAANDALSEDHSVTYTIPFKQAT